ncbi:hypothetical protein [Streptomyces sp. NPDC002671]
MDVDVPQWQELSTRHRTSEVVTYRVVMRPEKKAFSITDVVRTVELLGGPGRCAAGEGGVHRPERVDHFSSAEGHRLIRGVAGELGRREIQPASVKIAIGAAIVGGLGAVAALIAVAAVKWL